MNTSFSLDLEFPTDPHAIGDVVLPPIEKQVLTTDKPCPDLRRQQHPRQGESGPSLPLSFSIFYFFTAPLKWKPNGWPFLFCIVVCGRMGDTREMGKTCLLNFVPLDIWDKVHCRFGTTSQYGARSTDIQRFRQCEELWECPNEKNMQNSGPWPRTRFSLQQRRFYF